MSQLFKTSFSRLGTFVVCGALLGACAQLIGLSDYDEQGGAGESGDGSGAKSGSSAQGGLAGKSGAGGGSGNVGGRGGSAGSSGGRGGAAAAGRGGASAQGGDSGQGGAGDTGGEPAIVPVGGAGGEDNASYDCVSTTTITKVALLPRDPDTDIYPANNTFAIVTPQIGDFADDELWIDFYKSAKYDGDATGTFDLGAFPDNNYATCARCVWFGMDLGEVSDPQAYFYVKSGTMTIDPESLQMDGFPNLRIDKVTLIESVIDVEDTHVSTPVKNPRCLYLEHAEIAMPPPPSSWKCDLTYYGTDDGCDCGCGAPDPDCESELGGACDPNACGEEGSCSDSVYCDGIDPLDNSKCDATPDWICSPLYYGDSDRICDCACGVVDVDCPSKNPSVCESCMDALSCDPEGDCATLDPEDNSQCVMPVTP
jgi:hypothetical protein